MKYHEFYENKRHGSPELPVQYYDLNHASPQYIMPLHWHNEFELLRVNAGALTLYINNLPYRLQAGDVAFINCGMLHRGDPENCVYECIVFDLGMLRRQHNELLDHLILPLINGESAADLLLGRSDDILYASVGALFSTLREQPPYYELSVYGLIYRLFSLLYAAGRISAAGQNRRVGHRTDRITGLLDWIEAHYAEPITLGMLAARAGMNEKYLCRIFREYTGRTPVDYINALRIKYACYEMTENGKTVTEAAYACGFNDLSYFSRSFKRYVGVSAQAYRRSPQTAGAVI